jgi:hypothetical protein
VDLDNFVALYSYAEFYISKCQVAVCLQIIYFTSVFSDMSLFNLIGKLQVSQSIVLLVGNN